MTFPFPASALYYDSHDPLWSLSRTPVAVAPLACGQSMRVPAHADAHWPGRWGSAHYRQAAAVAADARLSADKRTRTVTATRAGNLDLFFLPLQDSLVAPFFQRIFLKRNWFIFSRENRNFLRKWCSQTSPTSTT